MNQSDCNAEAKPDASSTRQQLYERVRDDLLKRSLSNGESFDRAVLSLAAAIIGFTTVFLNDIKAAGSDSPHWSLQAGIWLLAFAVMTTITSIFTSQHALNEQIERAERVFLDGDESAREPPTSARITSGLNIASGVLFGLGVLAFVVFITVSLA